MASNLVSLIVCLMAMAASFQATSGTEYEVGESFGWNSPPNTTFYSEWASTKSFFVGDKLVFKSNSSVSDNVAEASTQSEYENCTNPGIVFGTSTVLTRTLDQSGAYYFLSTVHCEAGQKFTISVSTLPGTAISAPPPPSSAPPLSYGSVSALLITTAAIFSLS